MLPNTTITPETFEKYEQVTYPSKTYKIDFEKGKIEGFIDDIEAIKQTVFCILSTERYRFDVYSNNYGIELTELYGQDIRFVLPELQSRITDALLQDDRIISVSNFVFITEKKNIAVEFTIRTSAGDIDFDYNFEAVK